MFQPQTLIDEFAVHSPNIVSAVSDAVNNAMQDLDFIRLEKQAFAKIATPRKSDDTA
jgi:mannose-1-phosphate guanylyltransferase